MKKIAYDLIHIFALMLIGIGVYIVWGIGMAAIVGGATILILSIIELLISRTR